jgi:hypothetical protein
MLLLIPMAGFAENTGGGSSSMGRWGGLLDSGKARHGCTHRLLGAKAKIRLGIIGVNVKAGVGARKNVQSFWSGPRLAAMAADAVCRQAAGRCCAPQLFRPSHVQVCRSVILN